MSHGAKTQDKEEAEEREKDVEEQIEATEQRKNLQDEQFHFERYASKRS